MLAGSVHTGWGLGRLPPPASIASVVISPSGATSQPIQVSSQCRSTSVADSGQLSQRPAPAVSSQAMLGPRMSSSLGSSLPMSSLPTSPPASVLTGACLSPGSVPFPARLVAKARSGVYIEMKELLGDNIALLSELETFNGPHHLVGIPGVNKPRLREVASLSSWIYCFLAYLALRCPDDDTRERLVYAQLIVRESLRHGGKSWLTYDKVFRQQAALDGSLRWNELHPAILASTMLVSPLPSAQAPQGRAGTFCSLCQGVDHRADQCALKLSAPL